MGGAGGGSVGEWLGVRGRQSHWLGHHASRGRCSWGGRRLQNGWTWNLGPNTWSADRAGPCCAAGFTVRAFDLAVDQWTPFENVPSRGMEGPTIQRATIGHGGRVEYRYGDISDNSLVRELIEDCDGIPTPPSQLFLGRFAPVSRRFSAHFSPFFARSLRLGARKPDSTK